MKNFKVFDGKKGFVFFNGKLREVTFVRTKFRIIKDENGNRSYERHDFAKIGDGETFEITNAPVYASAEDYDKQNTIPVFEFAMTYVAGQIATQTPAKAIGNNVVFWRWCGEPSLVEREPEVFYYEYHNNSIVDCGNIIPKGEHIYESRENCLSFNEYSVVKEDGTTEKRTGINKLVMLDDDQLALLEDFKKAKQALKDNGVFLVYSDTEEFLAFNTRRVEGIDSIDDSEKKSDMEEIDFNDDHFWVKDSYTFYMPYHYGVYAKRKK